MRSVLLVALALVAAGCIDDAPADPLLQETAAPDSTTAPSEPPAEPEPEPEPEPAPEPAPAAPPEPQPEAAPVAPQPRFRTELHDGAITGAGASAAGTPAGDVCCATWWSAPEHSRATRVAAVVDPGATALLVELRWANATFDLDLALMAADYAERTPETPSSPSAPNATLWTGHRWTALDGAPGQGGGSARILVTDPEALALVGEWTAAVGAKGPAAQAAFTLAITLVTGAPIPEGWTALPAEG